MYNDSIKKHLLVKALRKDGWSIQEEEAIWLIKGAYHIRIDKEKFILYCDIRKGSTLIKLNEFAYGRRQTQLLKRAVSKHERESKKCIHIHLNSKGERRS